MKDKALENTVDDAVAEVDDKRHGYTQLIETLIITLIKMDTETLLAH